MSRLGQMGTRAAELAAAGRHAEAVSIWERMHRRQPGNPHVMIGLGAALADAGRVDDAVAWLTRCSQREPANTEMIRLTGRILIQDGKRQAALGAFYHALSIAPACAETHADIARALYAERQSSVALPHAQIACRANMSVANVWTYLCILDDLGRADEALALIDHLLVTNPADKTAYLTFRAALVQALGQWEEAIAAARETVLHAPNDKTAAHAYGAMLLLAGQLTQEAWQLYEGRASLLKQKAWPAQHLRWTTQDIRGLTLLVHAEQGLGDTLQFIRYIPLLAARGARVIVAVQPSLVSLLQGTPGAAEIISAGHLPPFDLYCPLLSLPNQFGTTMETIPPPLPYSLPNAHRSRSAKLQVGLVWAGRDVFSEDRKRSVAPAALAPLATVPDVEFHSLQFGATEMPFAGVRDAMEGVADFVDTAARIAELDLVIAVDTSVAHLAATMGKPVWLLARHNGCWRWLLDREDSPWYPSVRLFRQAYGQGWNGVIENIRQALVLAAAEHKAPLAVAA